MFYQLLTIIAPVFICVALGFIWRKTDYDYPNDFVVRVVMNIGAPCLIVSAFNNNRISVDTFSEVALAAVIIVVVSAFLAWLVSLRTHGDTITMVAPVAFPNWGNMGLALCLFAFGQQGLALGLAFFLVLLVLQIGVGVPLFMKASKGIFSQIMGLAKQPVIYAIFLSLFILINDYRLPSWAENTTTLLAGMTIPLMLISLGVSLAEVRNPRWGISVVFSLLRIFGGLGAAYLAITLLDIDGLAKKVVLLESILPAAVFNYLFASYYGRDKDVAAGIVIVSTLLSFIFIPVLLSFLL